MDLSGICIDERMPSIKGNLLEKWYIIFLIVSFSFQTCPMREYDAAGRTHSKLQCKCGANAAH